MKIKTGWKTIILSKVCSGEVIYRDASFYIVTDTSKGDIHNVYCVKLSTGALELLQDNEIVSVVPQATLNVRGDCL